MAIINSPPETSVDDRPQDRSVPPSVNLEWRNWFGAVYLICSASTQSGTTAQRPVKLLWTGRRFFDTTLGIPIFYKTAGWVNAAGAAV